MFLRQKTKEPSKKLKNVKNVNPETEDLKIKDFWKTPEQCLCFSSWVSRSRESTQELPKNLKNLQNLSGCGSQSNPLQHRLFHRCPPNLPNALPFHREIKGRNAV